MRHQRDVIGFRLDIPLLKTDLIGVLSLHFGKDLASNPFALTATRLVKKLHDNRGDHVAGFFPPPGNDTSTEHRRHGPYRQD
jgi:hypothetical protein